MAKKHWWHRCGAAEQRRKGIRGVCMDCGEVRQETLRGGICPGYRKSDDKP